MIAGVDGCRGGWLCITEAVDGQLNAEVLSTTTLMTKALTLDAMAIDIPIGLTDATARTVDREARRLLGNRGSSVFPVPVRAALAGASYAEACAFSFAACGKRLSRQTYGILPKIREIDAALRADMRLAAIVREVHPELCFLHLNGGLPMAHTKKSPTGFTDRRRLIEQLWPGAYDGIRVSFHRGLVQNDDILDALATLWTARRIRQRTAVSVPPVLERDRFGLPMAILA